MHVQTAYLREEARPGKPVVLGRPNRRSREGRNEMEAEHQVLSSQVGVTPCS